jgi:hypothetical protein
MVVDGQAMTVEHGKCSVFLLAVEMDGAQPRHHTARDGGAVSRGVGNCDHGKAQSSGPEAGQQHRVAGSL